MFACGARPKPLASAFNIWLNHGGTPLDRSTFEENVRQFRWVVCPRLGRKGTFSVLEAIFELAAHGEWDVPTPLRYKRKIPKDLTRVRYRDRDLVVIFKPEGWLMPGADVDLREGLEPPQGIKGLADSERGLLRLCKESSVQAYLHLWTQLTLHSWSGIVFDASANFGFGHRIEQLASGLVVLLSSAAFRKLFQRRNKQGQVMKRYTFLAPSRGVQCFKVASIDDRAGKIETTFQSVADGPDGSSIWQSGRLRLEGGLSTKCTATFIMILRRRYMEMWLRTLSSPSLGEYTQTCVPSLPFFSFQASSCDILSVITALRDNVVISELDSSLCTIGMPDKVEDLPADFGNWSTDRQTDFLLRRLIIPLARRRFRLGKREDVQAPIAGEFCQARLICSLLCDLLWQSMSSMTQKLLHLVRAHCWLGSIITSGMFS